MSSKTSVKWSLEHKAVQSAKLCSDGLLKGAVVWGRGKAGWQDK